MDEPQKIAATSGLVAFLNRNIEEYKDRVPCAQMLYSMANWAESYATDEHDCCAEDIAPELIEALEEIKAAFVASGLDVSTPGCAWFANGDQRRVMLDHGMDLDFLEWLPDEEE
jgi:hypothetical protein